MFETGGFTWRCRRSFFETKLPKYMNWENPISAPSLGRSRTKDEQITFLLSELHKKDLKIESLNKELRSKANVNVQNYHHEELITRLRKSVVFWRNKCVNLNNSSIEDFDPLKYLNLVCDFYNVSVDDIQSKSRKEKIVKPRHVVCYLFRNAGLTLVKTGLLLGDRDHSTVIHGHERIQGLVESGLLPKEEIEFIKNIGNQILEKTLIA